MPPLYDYGCDTCGHTVEVRHKITEEPSVRCEECKAVMSRMISIVPIRLDNSFPGERQKEVDARLKRQEHRLEDMVESGKLTEDDVDKMAAIRDEFAQDSPYMLDPKEAKQDPNPEEPSTGHFDDQLEM